MTEITNTQNTIDARDIFTRVEELETELQDLESQLEEANESQDAESIAAAKSELDEWQNDYAEELATLRKLAANVENYSSYGTLINDDYFEEYARDYAEGAGLIYRNLSWPYTCIDWENAADELKSDYTAIDFDGQTFWIS